MENLLHYLPIIIPSIMGYTSAAFCGVSKDSGKIVKFRPAPVVFSVVWSILYLLLGISWFLARENSKIENVDLVDVMYLALNIILCLWLYVYSCLADKKNAIYVIVISMVFTMFCYTVCENVLGKLAIVPLIGWLYLATLINIFEVEKDVFSS
jgi:tryptophan-rich sensory protein